MKEEELDELGLICVADVVAKEPGPCSWEGCTEKKAKYCRYPDPKGVRCGGLEFCAHHFYRHLRQKHPGMYRERMGSPKKGSQ